MEKQKKKSIKWLAIGIILCLISMIGASFVQSSGGKITIKDLRWETPSGHQMSALLYIPPNATAATPAPAIVTSHGWFNNREMQDLNYVEYARRGYVVMSIDMYGHGNSDVIPNEELTLRGTGMYDAVELMATFPYVDTTRIGVTGHSNGARACNLSVDDDNLAEKPLISAVFLVANDATYKNPETKEYWNKYGSRDVGIIAAQYDEFFFRSRREDGSITPPRDYITTPNAQSFLYFGADPAAEALDKRTASEFYSQSIEGQDSLRVIFTPAQIHPWNHFSKECVEYGVEFFDKAFGAPTPLAPSSQVWQIKVFFNTLGLFGLAIFLTSFTICMVFTPAFAPLRAKELVASAPAPSGAGKAWFWGGLAFSSIFAAIIYFPVLSLAAKYKPSFFWQGAPYGIGLWATLCALATILIMVLSYQLFGKKNGQNLAASGVKIGAKKLGLTVVLAVISAIATYSLVFLADFLFKTDYRIWVITFKAFTADKLLVMLPYLPLFLLYYVASSVATNCFNYVKLGKKPWVNTAVLAGFITLAPLVLVLAQYITFFVTGHLLTTGMSPLFSGMGHLGGIWLFPLLVILPVTVVISRKIYRVTQNPYLAGILNALVITVMSCTNTLTIRPV